MSDRRLRTALAALALVAAAIGMDRLRGRAIDDSARIWDTHEVFPLPAPPVVSRLALGYDEAAGAVLWAATLYQYGDHVGRNKRFPFAVQYLQVITHLTPEFLPAYKFASTLVTMQAINASREELDATRALLARGTEALPNSPETWGAYASFTMYEGAQFIPQPERATWRVDGARAAQRAVELGYFLDSLGRVGAQFLEQAGYRTLAIEQLQRSYAVAPNEETREQIRIRLMRLEGQEAADRMRRELAGFEARWRRDAPFVDAGLFLLLEEGRPPSQ
jgi:hypothetical protein